MDLTSRQIVSCTGAQAQRSGRPRVIVADDEAMSRRLAQGLLEKWGYEVSLASDGLEAWDLLQSVEGPTIAILDWLMPGLEGIELSRRVRALNRKHYLYIMMITGNQETQHMLECLGSGADDYLSKPFNPAELEARLRVAERIVGFQESLVVAQEQLAESEERYRSLVENSTALICTHDLEGKVLSINPAAANALGYTVEQCVGRNMRDGLLPEYKHFFDNYLAEIQRVEFANGNMAVLTRKGEKRIWAYTNRLIEGRVPYVLGHAQDVTERLQMQKTLRKTQSAALAMEKKLSRTDALTGLANRRAFYETAEEEKKRAARYSRALSLAYVDLDNFKQVNDENGHEAGDAVLACVARIMQKSLRAGSVAARLGGDEFAVLLPEAGYDEARLAVGRLHNLLTTAMLENSWPVTFSMGMITFDPPPDSIDQMVQAADRLMYAVKREGKNRVVTAFQGVDSPQPLVGESGLAEIGPIAESSRLHEKRLPS